MSVLTHRLPPVLLDRRVNVLLVGAGGTGSRMLDRLQCLHQALIAKRHPGGLMVTVVDADTVSPANIGRQSFYASDVGAYKADVLVNRANMALGNVAWQSRIAKIDTRSNLQDFDLVIGAVDNRSARLGILRSLENTLGGLRYWLDCGNRARDGQVVLGQVSSRKRETDPVDRLPHAGELFPALIDPTAEDDDDTPSCSLAEALDKQSLFINPVVADFAGVILWDLFTQGHIKAHGAFINLRPMAVAQIDVDPAVWARFGVVRDGVRRKVERPAVAQKRRVQRHPRRRKQVA
ncbi:PRTRC system ThiF family protein [Caenimonas sedimenti]|uniref:PRTRC system ThiF family protein n=1 Tax=Caenimonas sedimenti TaxID=2596921 RepID=A0A562ZT22_9BURK|nr:PRTRC system ThiF family protein [Caenimonas sedimenti]TWO71488.1 PRTRC system ThiF family protein [Caenimonas sedimenti]